MAQPTALPQATIKGGYGRLANFMAWYPRLTIFRRFHSLNLLNLMMLQAELSLLEESIKADFTEDNTSGEAERVEASIDFEKLKALGDNDLRVKTMRELTCKLAEYNEAVCKQITMSKQPSPTTSNLSLLRRFIIGSQGLDNELRGPGSMTWDDETEAGPPVEDLLTLDSSPEEPALPRWVLSPQYWYGLRHFQRKVNSFENQPEVLKFGSSKTWTLAGDQISNLLAAVMILVPVIVLHFIHDANARLIVIVTFTLAFLLVLAMTTNADRGQVFGAVAAFVAVQVVYVGSALNKGDQKPIQG